MKRPTTGSCCVVLLVAGCLGLPTASQVDEETHSEKGDTAVTDPTEGVVELKEVAALVADLAPGKAPGRVRWRWRSRSYVFMQTICAKAAGWDVDYDTIMTVSGVAGSFAYHHKDYVVNYFMPGPVDDRMTAATGFGFQWTKFPTPEACFQEIKRCIDAGKPVHAPFIEEVLFIGYQEAPDPDDRKVRPCAYVFVEPGQWWSWGEFMKWHKQHSAGGWLGRHTKRVKADTPRDAALTTLKMLVEYATNDPRAKNKRFQKNATTFGLAGLEAYAADIADLSKSGRPDGYFQGGWRGCHNIYPQLGGRWSTENHLKRLATSGALNPEATKHVAAAAEDYHAVCAAWEEFETHLADRNKDANKAWSTKANRLAGAAAVRKAIAHERAGLAHLRQALAAEGVKVEEWAAGETKGAPTEVFLKETLDLYRNGKAWNRVPEPEGSARAGQHSYLTFHFLQMRAAGWDEVDLDGVVVLSGASALYGYQHGSFMPKYAFQLPQVEAEDRIAKATGFGFEWIKFRDADHAWGVIRQSLDEGKPVRGYAAEHILFLGYRDAEKAQDRAVFAMAEEPEGFAKWLTWKEFSNWARREARPRLIGRHTKRLDAVPARETALRVIGDLVAWARKPPEAVQRRFPKALFGLTGLEAYAANCADVTRYPEWTICHDMNSQWPTRKSTAAWLKRLAEGKTFGAKVNEHLLAASKHYDKAVSGWVTAFQQVGWAAPQPWKEAGKDPTRRKAASDALRQAFEREREAVAELDRALALIGGDH